MRFSITAISLLGLALGCSAAPVDSEKGHGSWGLVAKGTGLDGIPIILGNQFDNSGSMYLANSTVPTADQTRLRFKLEKLTASTSNPANDNVIGARILDHPGISVDIYMWQTLAAKILQFSIPMEINGAAGSWGFKKANGEWLLALNDDTNARAVWIESNHGYQVYFGSDIPAGEVGTDIVLKGVFL